MSDTPVAPPPRQKRGRANDIDALVGKHIRHRRMLLGMSQSELAGSLGITFQQLQKYERGLNRVGAGRLYELSRVLQAPVSYFFSGTDEAEGPPVDLGPEAHGRGHQRETVELVRAYYGVKDRAIRRRILELVRALGGSDNVVAELGDVENSTHH